MDILSVRMVIVNKKRVMKKIYYLLACLFMLGSCFDDKGNYEYNAINDVSIQGFGTLDTVFRGLYLMDTLHFRGELSCTLDKEVNDEDYIWRWELEKSVYEKEIIAETRNLDLPLNMTPGKYQLHFQYRFYNRLLFPQKLRLHHNGHSYQIQS